MTMLDGQQRDRQTDKQGGRIACACERAGTHTHTHTLWADLSHYLRGHFYAKNGETKNAKPNL